MIKAYSNNKKYVRSSYSNTVVAFYSTKTAPVGSLTFGLLQIRARKRLATPGS